MPPVGLIGLGLVGQALAARLREAGIEVVGHDIEPGATETFARAGGRPAASPAGVFAATHTVLLSLPTDAEVRTVLDAAAQAMRPGHLVLDTTTGNPDAAPPLAARLATRGVTYLDSTISGSSEQARRGEAVWMVGGPTDAFARCQPLLERLTARAIHTGPTGSGARMKLVTNLVLGLNRAALAEGLVLAQALGLDARRALEVLAAGMAYSRIMDTKGPRMVERDFTPQARLSQHLKDVRLILDAAAAAGQELPLSRAHARLLEQGETVGLGALDNAAILRVLESLGPPPPKA